MSLLANLERMLAKGRDDAMLRFGLGSGYFSEADFEKAAVHLEQCILQDATYTAAYKLLGKAYFKLGNFGRAEEVFELGLPIAQAEGDKQTVKEISVFLKKMGKNSD